nr:hypothetical protein [Tanacetum cinerariifolium]
MSNSESFVNKGEIRKSSKKLKRKFETMKGCEGDERIMFEFILKGFAESEIWDKVKEPLSPKLNEDEYFICCKNTTHMFNALEKARMESREMHLSIHHSLKMLFDIISKMNKKLEDEKVKRNNKGKDNPFSSTTMGDANPIRTLGDYSKPSHKGYRNTIELPIGNNVVPLRSDIIRDFAKPVKAISLPQNVPSTSDRCLIELENQVQRLMEAHLAPMQPTQVEKITSSYEICSGLHDTQYCMENPKQAFVEYESSRTDDARGDDGYMMFIEIVKKNDDSRNEKPEAEGLEVEYFDMFLTQSEFPSHKYLMCGTILSIFLRNLIITEGCLSNLKIPCNIRHVHVEKAYIDLNSPLNIMTQMMYNWIMKRKLDPRENLDRGVRDFTGRIKGMHVFVRNFAYVIDFMIVEDISSIINPRLSQVALGKPFIEISNMTHDPPEGVVRNEEDNRREEEYVMSKILEFYKECLELGPEYVTGMDDEGEVT